MASLKFAIHVVSENFTSLALPFILPYYTMDDSGKISRHKKNLSKRFTVCLPVFRNEVAAGRQTGHGRKNVFSLKIKR
jgi:hypothetical protein